MPIRGPRRPHVVPITAPSFPTPPQPRVYRKIAYTFIAFTILTVIAVLWLSSVTAHVTVTVKKIPLRLDSSIEVARYPRSGQIPGRVVQGVYFKNQEFAVQAQTQPQTATDTTNLSAESSQMPILATSTAPATPSATSSTGIARGKVRVVNNYSRTQTLVRTTRLLTADGKLYHIDKKIVIPSNQEVEVDVYADKPGSDYAIAPTKFTIPGLFIDLQKFIYAESDQPFSINGSAPVVVNTVTTTTRPTTALPRPRSTSSTGLMLTREALDNAYNQLKDAVLDQAKRELAGEIADPNLSEAVYYVKVVDKSSTVLPGQIAATYIATVKLDVTAVFYPKEDMLSIIRDRLREKIPEGREFLPLDNGNVVYTLDAVDAKAETATIGIKAEGGYRLTPQSPPLQKEAMAGKTRDEVESNLKALDGVDNVDITMSPNWLSRIPTLKDHIEVEVK